MAAGCKTSFAKAWLESSPFLYGEFHGRGSIVSLLGKARARKNLNLTGWAFRRSKLSQMAFKELFPTTISQGTLSRSLSLRKKLLSDIELISKEDKLGKQWSEENYRGGYTSYASLNNLHHRYPSFMEFEKLIAKEALAFAKKLGWDLKGLELRMTDCWANIMPADTYHTLHFHPHSVLSGAFYVTAPKESVALKLEDPRMGFFMNAPQGRPLYFEVPAEEGKFVLFESWLRHEVPPNRSKKARISISFNYTLESEAE
jgi:uncharacterized protein (TIGR02466 family)